MIQILLVPIFQVVSFYVQKMGIFGKAMAISVGVVVGGGLGFYLKETYFLRVKEKRCAELEGELQELARTRKSKEELLKTRRNESNGD